MRNSLQRQRPSESFLATRKSFCGGRASTQERLWAFSAFTWFKTGQDWVIETWKGCLSYLQQHDEHQVPDIYDSDFQEVASRGDDVAD
jgi:hypothetical protein